MPARHVGDGFVGSGRRGRKKEFARHAEFRRPGKQRRQRGRNKLRRDHEHQAVGQGDEAVPDDDVGSALAVIGRKKLISDAEFPAKRGGCGFLGQKRIGAAFDDATVDCFRTDDAAEAVGSLIEVVFDGLADSGIRAALLFQGPGGAEAGDASADDGNTSQE